MSIAGWIKPAHCGICEKKLDPRGDRHHDKPKFAFGFNWCADCIERLKWRTFEENHIEEKKK